MNAFSIALLAASSLGGASQEFGVDMCVSSFLTFRDQCGRDPKMNGTCPDNSTTCRDLEQSAMDSCGDRLVEFDDRNATVSTMVEEEKKMCGDPCFRALEMLHSCFGCGPDCREFVATINATCSNQTFWEMGEELLVTSRAAMFSDMCVEGGCGEDYFPLMQCMMEEDGGGMMFSPNKTQSLCEANSTCAHHLQGAEKKCHGIIPEEGMETFTMLKQMCECMPLVSGLQPACMGNPMDVCNRDTTCGQQVTMLEMQCADFPGVQEMLGQFGPMCEDGCMPLMSAYESVCQDQRDVCNPETACGQHVTMLAMACADIPEFANMFDTMCEANPPPAHCVDIPTTVARRFQTKPCIFRPDLS